MRSLTLSQNRRQEYRGRAALQRRVTNKKKEQGFSPSDRARFRTRHPSRHPSRIYRPQFSWARPSSPPPPASAPDTADRETTGPTPAFSYPPAYTYAKYECGDSRPRLSIERKLDQAPKTTPVIPSSLIARNPYSNPAAPNP